jgi:hypothetical protein
MLSAPEIQSKLSLPYTPTDYTTATIPAGTEMYTGTVAPLNPDPTSGVDPQPGGATQWQVKTGFDKDTFDSFFKESSPIPQPQAPEAPIEDPIMPDIIPEFPVVEVPIVIP